jgi:hypothetical protein
MEKLISCCGLNCASCEARIATIKNDDEMRKETAKKWSEMFNAPEIDFRTINCTGCREEGVKISHVPECKIRNCAIGKGFKTCGECDELDTCSIIAEIHKFAPDALTNLRDLN